MNDLTRASVLSASVRRRSQCAVMRTPLTLLDESGNKMAPGANVVDPAAAENLKLATFLSGACQVLV